MSFSDRTMTEPYTSREVSTVPGEGDAKRCELSEFNSDNTCRLNLEETKAKIASLEYIQNELNEVLKLAK